MSDPAAYIVPMRDLLPQNARLLVQAGATDGDLPRAYHKLYPATSLMVVEAEAERAQQARHYADRVHQADLNTVGDAFYRQAAMADGWYFDATLEQLRNPLHVLKQVRKVMPVDTCIIARIANRNYWDKPAATPLHSWGIAEILTLFQQAGLRVVSGVLLNPAPLPAAIDSALRQQAAQLGQPAEPLLDAAQPSHYLIKAMPA